MVEVEGKHARVSPFKTEAELNGRTESRVEPRQLRKQGDNLHLHQVYIQVPQGLAVQSFLFLLKTPFFFFFFFLAFLEDG